MQILIIDDEAELRLIIREMLESVGHEVIEAENGVVGLEIYRKVRLDAVITDILMPLKDGIETIRDIRAVDSQMCIIAVSGGGPSQDMNFLRIAGRLGATATLEKPFGREQLLTCLDEHAMPGKS
jgi:CheY-like chemotaxis protein